MFDTARYNLINTSLKQKGAALLTYMLILVTGVSYLMLNQLNAATKIHIRQQVTNRALTEAKQALIGRAVVDANRPGSLPVLIVIMMVVPIYLLGMHVHPIRDVYPGVL